MSSSTFFSIIVLNLNGKNCLFECLDSILRSRFSSFELILVDCKSADDSAKLAKAKYQGDKRVRVIECDVDPGVSGGFNIGLRAARGDILVVVANDTVVADDWLNQIIPVFDSDPSIGAAQGKLVSYHDPGMLDGTGCFIDWHGCPRERGGAFLSIPAERDLAPAETRIEDIFSGTLNCLFLRRECLERVGLFDEDLWILCEDVDLCWRIHLAGYRVVLVPQCVIRHKRSQTGQGLRNPRHALTRGWHMHKNKLAICLKNMGPISLLRALPALLFLTGLRAVYGLCVLRSMAECYAPIKGLLWNLRHLPATLKKRSHIQKTVRRVPESEMSEWYSKSCFLRTHSGPTEWPVPRHLQVNPVVSVKTVE